MTTTIKIGKIVAAILALEKAISVLHGPHESNISIAMECIDAKVGLEWAIRDIQVDIDTQEAA